jgi:hypothetical protein
VPRWPKPENIKPSESREDWCWLAGIFEGEGTAVLRFNKSRWLNTPRRAYLYSSISQTNLEMLEEVRRIVGSGKVYLNKKRAGRNEKPLWVWYIACANARVFLNQLLPFMRSPHQREQVILSLADDIQARAEGTRVRQATLTKCRIARWESHRAGISKEKVAS